MSKCCYRRSSGITTTTAGVLLQEGVQLLPQHTRAYILRRWCALTVASAPLGRVKCGAGKIISQHDNDSSSDRRESIKRGMIRYLYLAIDLSKTMSEGDMRPSRLAVTLRIVQDFVTNYFDQNPLSQLGILVTR